MANKYEAYESRLKNFNNKYKVDFSFAKYDSQSLGKKNLAPALKGAQGISKENLKYKNALLGIYKQCVENVMNKNYNSFDPAQLIGDFEKLMGGYREYCKDNGKTAPDVNGGWQSGSEIIDDMRASLQSINPVKVAHTKDKYLSGNLRLRDMKADVKERCKNGASNISVEDLAVISAYREALDSVVKERSIWWKINPLNWARNNAEQKLAAALGIIINMNTEHIIEADDIVEENVIPDMESALGKSAEKIAAQESALNKAGSEPVRENLKLDFLSENNQVKDVSQKVEESKSLAKENILQA